MFMDDLTKIKKQYFLQAKSGALDSLYNFVRDIAIPGELHVGRLRSDNGGEYTGKAFRDYCKTVGIKQEFTAPYTRQQNAPIERVWGTLMAVTRCLLQESGLPSVLWPEAFATTTTYIGNRVPTSSLAGVRHTLHGLAHRHPWLTSAYGVHVPSCTRSVLNPGANCAIEPGKAALCSTEKRAAPTGSGNGALGPSSSPGASHSSSPELL
ncbi:unnamed protein product, partial [Discosporangium mesarthrocarpum]